jgi:hypothetical protein
MIKYKILPKLILVVLISTIAHTQLLSQSNFPSNWPDRIVLNATATPSTSIAVTWRTNTTITSGYCELQPATDTRINPKDSKSFKATTTTVTYQNKNEAAVIANQHSYIITGLTPGAEYIYRVGADENWSEWFQFSTPSEDNDEFSFIYLGDPQVSLRSQCAKVIRKAFQESPDAGFMFYAGDVINRAGRDSEWQGFFDAGSFILASIPQLMTPGNHDYDDLTLDPHWNSQFTLPTNGPAGLDGTCYFVDYKNLRLISIDSATDGELENEDGYELTSQKAWLDSVLSNNTQKWTIVTTHLPFYSPKQSRDNKQLRKHFQPILEKHGVDMVLTGHDHSYGRGTATDNPNIKPSIIYVVSVSGPKLYEAGDKDWMQKSISYTMLYQVISINDNNLSYKAFDATGKLRDEFKLTKNSSGKNKLTDLQPK